MTDAPGAWAEELFELSLDLLVVADAESRIVKVNPSWERVLGYRPDELVGRWIVDLHHPDDVARTRERLRLIAEGRPVGRFENRYRHADGHYVWLRWTASVDAARGLVYGAARDVTDEKAREEGAAAAIQRMENAERVAQVGSWEWDQRTGERHYTTQMYAIQGMDPERDEPWGMEELLERVAPEHHERLREAARRMYRGPGQVDVEYRMVAPHERWIRTTMEAVFDAAGQVVLVRGTTQDVTQLRDNERRLAEAERLADIGSFEWRVSDGAVRWSEGTYRLFGRDPSLPPLTRTDLEPMALAEEVARAAAVLERSATGEPWELEFSIPWSGQKMRRILAVRGEAYQSGSETFVRGTMQDVTAARRAARQQQELARLGQLALEGTDLRELFDEVCRVTVDVLGTDVAGVLALQNDGSLAYAATLGYPEGTSGTAIAAGSGGSLVHDVLASNRPLIVPDWRAPAADHLDYAEPLRASGVLSTAILPIRGRDGPFGVLTTHALEAGVPDPEANLAFLDAMSSFLATAIERLRHETEIAALATLRGRLVAENLEAEERVRQRISEQLHDGALQDLLAARQDLVEAGGARDDATREEMLGYAREGVERAVRQLRDAVHALHPVVLQHGGLEAAMQAAADQAARQGGFAAEVAVDPEATGLRDELVLSLARELLTNAAKHAEAQRVRVRVARDDGAVLLEVADDGVGLDPGAIAAAPLNGHIGLASMAQRVEAVGGTLALDGAGGGPGTTVLARLPID